MKRVGILLVNIGTPVSPEPPQVGRYLKEFLMDPFVVDIPFIFRWILVNVLIVPRRQKDSSLLYQKVWTEKGSPLLVYSKSLETKLQEKMGDSAVVRLGMRYGVPSISNALQEMAELHVEKLILVPLYPQFSDAATTTSVLKTQELVKDFLGDVEVDVVPPFYGTKEFIESFTEVAKPYIEKRNWDKVLFSYHGLPERQVKRTDPTGKACRCDTTCCDAITQNNQNCYRAQCYETTRLLAENLGLKPEEYLVGFQSRLGRTPWIKPHSDEYYRALPKEGVKNLLVLSPSFVSDCLETLEEIRIRGKKEFVENGGKDLTLIPSLNDSPIWVENLKNLIRL